MITASIITVLRLFSERRRDAFRAERTFIEQSRPGSLILDHLSSLSRYTPTMATLPESKYFARNRRLTVQEQADLDEHARRRWAFMHNETDEEKLNVLRGKKSKMKKENTTVPSGSRRRR